MNAPNIVAAAARGEPTQRWQQLLADAVRDVAELHELLELDQHETTAIQPDGNEFPVLIPRGFISRMRKGDPRDPLLLQVLPIVEERKTPEHFTTDPLNEMTVTTAGVISKYASRSLLITTAACPVHCRYCFRRHFPYDAQLASRDGWVTALNELKSRDGIREVILSGGDPLSLSNRRLEALISELQAVDTVTTLRIHSRFPIILPERIDAELLSLLSSTSLRTVVVVHCNHENEIDSSVQSALRKIAATNTLLLNQSVLLQGVNDNIESLEALSYRLFESGVLPYYLHQLDRVIGAAHFEVDDASARVLIAELRARLPGYLVPRLVREIPGELSKTPIV